MKSSFYCTKNVCIYKSAAPSQARVQAPCQIEFQQKEISDSEHLYVSKIVSWKLQLLWSFLEEVQKSQQIDARWPKKLQFEEIPKSIQFEALI